MDFVLPPALEASAPPETRGLRRDEVRLLVSDVRGGTIEHARFRELSRWLEPGDVLVVNTSGTLNAALPVVATDGRHLQLHLSTQLPGGFWTVELRRLHDGVSHPFHTAEAGERLQLPAGGQATLLAPYPNAVPETARKRLWIATMQLPESTARYLTEYGAPIRYRYVKATWPSEMYQTVFATEPGSAEMPSAGRPFTSDLVTTLVAHGVQVAPVLLHTGVSSLEDHEPPYEEYFRVPRDTAARVTAARQAGRRVIAVGTTVVRALETVTDEAGVTSPGEGWTGLVISPSRPVRAIDGLITGLHEPHASHLMMLEQVAAAAHRRGAGHQTSSSRDSLAVLERAYAEALEKGYLWHEFGDAHLIL
jgi:S-adenosylmethionine:tRNA ribosyltransferase-isomerase